MSKLYFRKLVLGARDTAHGMLIRKTRVTEDQIDFWAPNQLFCNERPQFSLGSAIFVRPLTGFSPFGGSSQAEATGSLGELVAWMIQVTESLLSNQLFCDV